MAQDSLSKSLDAEHFLHHFTDKEMVTTQHIISLFFLIFPHSSSTIVTLQTCFASAIESLFELCLRIRAFPITILPLFLSLNNLPGLSPSSDPGRKAHQEHLFLSLVQKLHSASFSIKHHAGSDSANFSKQCEDWRLRSFQMYQRVFSLMQQCGDNLDLPKSLHFHWGINYRIFHSWNAEGSQGPWRVSPSQFLRCVRDCVLEFAHHLQQFTSVGRKNCDVSLSYLGQSALLFSSLFSASVGVHVFIEKAWTRCISALICKIVKKESKTDELQLCSSQFHGQPSVVVTAAYPQTWHTQWRLLVLRHSCRFRQIYHNEWWGRVGMLPMNAWLSQRYRKSARWTWQQRTNQRNVRFNQKVIAIASSLDGRKYPTPNTQWKQRIQVHWKKRWMYCSTL